MNTSRYYQYIFPGTIAFSVVLMLIGLSMGHPEQLLSGLWKIVTMQDLLITDYIHIAGPAAAFVNAGLVTIISILIIKLAKDPFNGFTIVEMGLMAGFSLFGKNVFNIWPIILGTWLYARYQKEPFSKYASVALLATALAPLVSYMALGSVHASLPLGVFTGILVGFLLPSLSAYTYKIQNGMNLYNMGFACGLFAMMVVPILTAFGDKPDSALYWSTGHNRELVTVLTPETDYYPAWYILQVIRQDGVELWSAGAHPSHAGWTSVFACKIDGEDYLLQYEPEMYQGWAEYAYELWAFDGNGQAYTSDNRSVTFDINFGREEHQFDPEAIAGFFWERRGLLQDSILLASTENGEFQTGIPGLELQNYIFSDLLSLDSLEAMEASVRQQEAELGAA